MSLFSRITDFFQSVGQIQKIYFKMTVNYCIIICIHLYEILLGNLVYFALQSMFLNVSASWLWNFWKEIISENHKSTFLCLEDVYLTAHCSFQKWFSLIAYICIMFIARKVMEEQWKFEVWNMLFNQDCGYCIWNHLVIQKNLIWCRIFDNCLPISYFQKVIKSIGFRIMLK